jgi:hypothetical protein
MSTIIAIDPGSQESAWVIMNGMDVLDFAKESNERVRAALGLRDTHDTLLAIEYMRARGMPFSNESIDTMFWAGRFVEAWGGNWAPVDRKDVKMAVCGSSRATDANIRRAVIDMYPRTGGGNEPAVGIKSDKGPLYGVSGDVWQALAVGLTFQETNPAEVDSCVEHRSDA